VQPAAPSVPAANANTPNPAVPALPLTPEPPPLTWVARPSANVVVLDKVSARATSVAIKVGGMATIGSLTVAVRACDARPPEQPADATAWLDITDSHPGEPGFHGWMFAAEPAISMLGHPIYDVRLAGCAG